MKEANLLKRKVEKSLTRLDTLLTWVEAYRARLEDGFQPQKPAPEIPKPNKPPATPQVVLDAPASAGSAPATPQVPNAPASAEVLSDSALASSTEGPALSTEEPPNAPTSAESASAKPASSTEDSKASHEESQRWRASYETKMHAKKERSDEEAELKLFALREQLDLEFRDFEKIIEKNLDSEMNVGKETNLNLGQQLRDSYKQILLNQRLNGLKHRRGYGLAHCHQALQELNDVIALAYQEKDGIGLDFYHDYWEHSYASNGNEGNNGNSIRDLEGRIQFEHFDVKWEEIQFHLKKTADAFGQFAKALHLGGFTTISFTGGPIMGGMGGGISSSIMGGGGISDFPFSPFSFGQNHNGLNNGNYNKQILGQEPTIASFLKFETNRKGANQAAMNLMIAANEFFWLWRKMETAKEQRRSLWKKVLDTYIPEKEFPPFSGPEDNMEDELDKNTKDVNTGGGVSTHRKDSEIETPSYLEQALKSSSFEVKRNIRRHVFKSGSLLHSKTVRRHTEKHKTFHFFEDLDKEDLGRDKDKREAFRIEDRDKDKREAFRLEDKMGRLKRKISRLELMKTKFGGYEMENMLKSDAKKMKELDEAIQLQTGYPIKELDQAIQLREEDYRNLVLAQKKVLTRMRSSEKKNYERKEEQKKQTLDLLKALMRRVRELDYSAYRVKELGKTMYTSQCRFPLYEPQSRKQNPT